MKEFISFIDFTNLSDEEKYKLLNKKDYEIERLNNIKNDLLYVLSQLNGYLDKGWTIDLNFTDIREKYKQDIEEYENWK